MIRFLTGLMFLSLLAFGSGCNSLAVFFPSNDYDTVAPELPAQIQRPAILVFSKTNGFRHEEAIPAGLALFERLAKEKGWGLFATENGAVIAPEILARFDAVVWHNTSADTLNDEQKATLKKWILEGGGFVALHGSGGDPSYDWQWYVDELIGAQFTSHTMGPQFQEGTLKVEDPNHPATRDLPPSFSHMEEWYSFANNPRDKGFNILMTVDESTYSPEFHLLWMDEDLRMGDHPVVWSRCLGKGRTFYSALGHQAEAYETEEMASLLSGALSWAAGLEGPPCDGS